MVQAGRIIDQIRMCSAFRNSYIVALRGGSTWQFRMPLYRIVIDEVHGAQDQGSSRMWWRTL